MSRLRTLPWSNVLDRYKELRESGQANQPMVDLVQYMESSRYATALFPSLSDDLLRIGRVADFTPGDMELQIGFSIPTQRFTFTHLQGPTERNAWVRECEASEWRHVLERILHKRLQWFHEG
jgi:hypothetical protein